MVNLATNLATDLSGSEPQPLEGRLAAFGLTLVQQAVGSGGSAIVHQAKVARSGGRMPAVGTLVAIKQYKRELIMQEGQLKRVQQEADLGSTFDSPNVVKTYGLMPTPEDPEFLVMEWIDGGTVADWSRRTQDLSWEKLKTVALGIVAGLETLHAHKVLHRDLKPENVMLRNDGTAVIMDIGVAELTAEQAETLHTNVGQFLGSMRYASPQYLMGEKFAASDDVYGLGSILYELFTGRSMFEGHERKTALPILVFQEGQRVESLREVVPAPVRVLVQAAINRERSRRPSLSEAKAALEDPAGSSFISRELERQTAEERGFPVIQTLNDGMAFYADVGTADTTLEDEFTVVRRTAPVRVPSLSRAISPEQWVATVVLKHVYQNIGHFVVLGKRWQEGTKTKYDFAALFNSPGRWVEHEEIAPKVAINDWVLKRKA